MGVSEINPWAGLAIGVLLLILTWHSVIVTTIQPRTVTSYITFLGWAPVNALFQFLASRTHRYERKDRVLALLAPVSLLMMLVVWLLLFLVSYALIFWPLVGDLATSFDLAGSSLLTLGFTAPHQGGPTALEFIAAATGMIIIALQIGYLPTLYGAFNRRETLVTALNIRAGSPSWGPEILARHQSPRARATLPALFAAWETWAADIMESHSSYPWLLVFRSHEALHSWSVSLLAVLDAAALYLALAPDEVPEEAHQCVQSGIVALGKLGRLAQNPRGSSPEEVSGLHANGVHDGATVSEIALPFDRFGGAYAYLRNTEFPVHCSVEEAWETFSSWRARYEADAYALNDFTVAVPAPWSGPRRNMTRHEAYEVIAHPTLPPEPAEVSGDPTQRQSD
jgi:hypothetical protein